MPTFGVQLTRRATADLDKLVREVRLQVMKAIAGLAEKPFPEGQGKKRLKGFDFPLYRLRSGNYRVLYRLDGQTVTILRVIDRKDLERIAKRLRL